jgi:hypothetical protein
MTEEEAGFEGIHRPSRRQIAARAYQIYLERGRQDGHDMDDWLQAEYELMKLPIRKIAELTSWKPVKDPRVRKSLVALVRAAMVAGAGGLTHLVRSR